jgi:hypothetical protein
MYVCMYVCLRARLRHSGCENVRSRECPCYTCYSWVVEESEIGGALLHLLQLVGLSAPSGRVA